MAGLIAAITAIVVFVVGALLVGFGHVFLGIVVALGSLPFALAVWMKVGDR